MFPTLDEVRAYAAEGRYRRVPVRMELLATGWATSRTTT